jgi:hypothetical protein
VENGVGADDDPDMRAVWIRVVADEDQVPRLGLRDDDSRERIPPELG